MSDEWEMDTCPYCNQELMPVAGKLRGALALIITGEPGKDDLSAGTPLGGRLGTVMENELFFRDIRLRDCRRMTLWPHPDNGSQECLNFGIQRVVTEASHHRLILLMGAFAVKQLTGMDVSKVTSLVVKSDYFPTQVLVASVDPAIVFHDAVGELRLAIKRFHEEMEKLYRDE